MIDLKVTVLGGPEIAAKLARADSGIRDELRDELAQVGDEIVARAQAAAPVRTGGLRARIVWYFGREMRVGVPGSRRRVTQPVDVKWEDGRIEMVARPRGNVAHLMERGVDATFTPRPKRDRGGNVYETKIYVDAAGRHRFRKTIARGILFQKPRHLVIRARPFFMPAVDSIGGASGVNARLQARLDRLATSISEAA